jgi:hypothetical protein
VAKDQRIEQREDLIDRREEEREQDETPVGAEVAEEGVHR